MKTKQTSPSSVAKSCEPLPPPALPRDYRFSLNIGPLGEDSLTVLLVFRFRTGLLDSDQVERVFAGRRVLVEECLRAGWLKQCISANRLVVYSVSDVAKCVIRVMTEGRPPPPERYTLPLNLILPPLLG